jgi:hypothetical protein
LWNADYCGRTVAGGQSIFKGGKKDASGVIFIFLDETFVAFQIQ